MRDSIQSIFAEVPFLHWNVPLLQSGGGWRFDGPKIFARSVGFSDIRRFGPGSGNGGKQP